MKCICDLSGTREVPATLMEGDAFGCEVGESPVRIERIPREISVGVNPWSMRGVVVTVLSRGAP